MTDLERDLEELSSTLPNLPELVQELLGEAQALSEAVSSLEDDLAAARTELAQSLAATHTALPGLAQQLNAARDRLASSLQAATLAWQEARKDLEEAVDGVERSAELAEGARLDLQQGLSGWAGRATAANAATATLEVVDAAREAVPHLEATVAAVDEQGAALRGAIASEVEGLQAEATSLHQRLLDLTVRVQGDVGYMTGEEMYRRLGDDARVRGVAADQVESRAAALVGDVEQQISALVTTPLRTVADRVSEALAACGSTASTYAEALSGARPLLLESLGEATDATSPLADVYAEVEEATRRVTGP